MNIDYSEHLQLAKRHSFPYMKVYTWNTLGGSQSQVKEIPLNNAGDSVPAIKSDGTSQERQARLEEAMVWIRKELVRIYEIKFKIVRRTNIKQLFFSYSFILFSIWKYECRLQTRHGFKSGKS